MNRPSVSDNERHIANPQPGDYWQEMFCPVFVVVGRAAGGVVVCDEKVSVDKDHWTFNFEKLKWSSLADLRKRVTYDTMPDKFWCDVMPGHLKDWIEGIEP